MQVTSFGFVNKPSSELFLCQKPSGTVQLLTVSSKSYLTSHKHQTSVSECLRNIDLPYVHRTNCKHQHCINTDHYHHHHHHKYHGLDPLIRSVSRVTTAVSNVSSVFQMFSFLVVCSSMIARGFCYFMTFMTTRQTTTYAANYGLQAY